MKNKDSYSANAQLASQLKDKGNYLPAQKAAEKAVKSASCQNEFNGACQLLNQITAKIANTAYTLH